MPGPARAGLFIYAKDTERIASFYQAVAGMTRLAVSEELIVIESLDIQILVHSIPRAIADTINITSPPQRRYNTALKFFLTVNSLATARSVSATLGGEVFNENWHGPRFVVCSAIDPEGNIFHLRENR